MEIMWCKNIPKITQMPSGVLFAPKRLTSAISGLDRHDKGFQEPTYKSRYLVYFSHSIFVCNNKKIALVTKKWMDNSEVYNMKKNSRLAMQRDPIFTAVNKSLNSL